MRLEEKTATTISRDAELQLPILPSLAVWPRPPVVLVTSDLHLGDANTSAAPTLGSERKCADAAFRRWLDFYRNEASRGALLVLNGDTFDFMRAFGSPRTPQEFGDWAALLPERLKHKATAVNISRAERRFGLKAEVHKAVWKVHAIAAAHPHVFAGLADWIARGGRLLLVKGNHDLELHWREVCGAVTHELTSHMALIENAADIARERIFFSEERVTLDNIWIEHGHRWQFLTAVKGTATAGDDFSRLRLPRGALAAKYLVNVLERGNGTGQVRFGLPVLLSLMTLGATGALINGILQLLIPVLFFCSMLHRAVAARISALLHTFGCGLLARKSVAQVAKGAREILTQSHGTGAWSQPSFAVMGHTHVQQVSELSTSSGMAVYVNTGAWNPTLRRGDAQFRFAQFRREHDRAYSFSALVWDEVDGVSRNPLDGLPATG